MPTVLEQRGVSRQVCRNRAGVEGRAEEARRLLRSCRLCERACGVDRLAGEAGWCGCDHHSYAYCEGLLWNEEAFITPSYALFFAGCNLGCAFCYALDLNRAPAECEPVDGEAVVSRLRACATSPATFSFIGGEPSVHLHTALGLVATLPAELPVVWNSNFYFTQECSRLLAGSVDVFIADLHFGNDACARGIADADDYLRVVGRNLRWAREAGTLVVRHLVLPGHVECCTAPALSWLAKEFPDVRVNVLTNYLPPEARLMGCLERRLEEGEVRRTRQIVLDLGLETIE